MTVRIKDAIDFHSANEGDIFLKRLAPHGFAGIPAIHLDDDAGICLKQRIQKLDRYVGLRAVFWTAPAQTIAQGKITRTDIGAKYLITVYLFTLQMGIVPTRSFHGPRGLGGRFLLLNDRIVYAQVNGGYPYTTVANFYYVAIRSGLWEKIRTVLVERVRTDAGRNPSPSYAIIDSQSVKTTYAAEERGIDGGKTKGRKRHIVVDTMGNLLAVVVHAANIHDTKAGILAGRDAYRKYPSIQRFCADAGYRKTFEQDISGELGLGVDISVRIKPQWEVLPKRWIVERSLAWLSNSRRLSKDYEISVHSAQAVCIIAAFHTLFKRF